MIRPNSTPNPLALPLIHFLTPFHSISTANPAPAPFPLPGAFLLINISIFKYYYIVEWKVVWN